MFMALPGNNSLMVSRALRSLSIMKLFNSLQDIELSFLNWVMSHLKFSLVSLATRAIQTTSLFPREFSQSIITSVKFLFVSLYVPSMNRILGQFRNDFFISSVIIYMTSVFPSTISERTSASLY